MWGHHDPNHIVGLVAAVGAARVGGRRLHTARFGRAGPAPRSKARQQQTSEHFPRAGVRLGRPIERMKCGEAGQHLGAVVSGSEPEASSRPERQRQTQTRRSGPQRLHSEASLPPYDGWFLCRFLRRTRRVFTATGVRPERALSDIGRSADLPGEAASRLPRVSRSDLFVVGRA